MQEALETENFIECRCLLHNIYMASKVNRQYEFRANTYKYFFQSVHNT